VGIWGKNLSDEQYYAKHAEQGTQGGNVVAPAPPRTYGFTVSYEF
jgi:outer membrane receptor protein involved in Fe transport